MDEWCSDHCRLAQHCFSDKKGSGKDPETCMEFIKLEEIAFDCERDREEELPFTDQPEDEWDEEWEDELNL